MFRCYVLVLEVKLEGSSAAHRGSIRPTAFLNLVTKSRIRESYTFISRCIGSIAPHVIMWMARAFLGNDL
jgi:hypothetical protein